MNVEETDVKRRGMGPRDHYRDSVGNPELRALHVEALYREYDKAKSPKYKNFLAQTLIALGEGDYSEADHGTHWSDNQN